MQGNRMAHASGGKGQTSWNYVRRSSNSLNFAQRVCGESYLWT